MDKLIRGDAVALVLDMLKAQQITKADLTDNAYIELSN